MSTRIVTWRGNIFILEFDKKLVEIGPEMTGNFGGILRGLLVFPILFIFIKDICIWIIMEAVKVSQLSE